MALHDLWQSESKIGTEMYFARSADGSAMASGFTPMAIVYQRDDQRRLITVTVTEPCSVDDLSRVIDRQAGEDTSKYAQLYDLRTMTDASTEAYLQEIAERVKVARGGRERGPVGIAMRARPALFLLGLMHATLLKEFASIEVLLSAAQIDAWLARNAPRGWPRGL